MSLRYRSTFPRLLFLGCLGVISIALDARDQVRVREETIDWGKILLLLFEAGPEFALRPDAVEAIDGYGVVAGGWPVVVDYQLEGAGFLQIVVGIESGQSPLLRIPADGFAAAGERRTDIVRLPPDLGGEARAGSFAVRAFAREDATRPMGFRLFGIGAGEGAVASIAIDKLRFAPRKIDLSRKQRAELSFRSRRDFAKVRLQITRLPGPRERLPPAVVWKLEPPWAPSQGREYRETWDGRDDGKKRPSEGLHTLQIYVWSGPVAGKHWTAGTTTDLVSVVK